MFLAPTFFSRWGYKTNGCGNGTKLLSQGKENHRFAQPSWLKQTWLDDGDIKFMRKALKESPHEFRAHMLKVEKHIN